MHSCMHVIVFVEKDSCKVDRVYSCKKVCGPEDVKSKIVAKKLS